MPLTITRKPGQVLNFPELGISITIIESRRSGVKLAIDAPRDLRVLRGELADHAAASTAEPREASDAA